MDHVNLDIPCFVDLALPVHNLRHPRRRMDAIAELNPQFYLRVTPYSYRYNDDRYVQRLALYMYFTNLSQSCLAQQQIDTHDRSVRSHFYERA
jgi:hypothetical protein